MGPDTSSYSSECVKAGGKSQALLFIVDYASLCQFHFQEKHRENADIPSVRLDQEWFAWAEAMRPFQSRLNGSHTFVNLFRDRSSTITAMESISTTALRGRTEE